jgi:hypothetical protein
MDTEAEANLEGQLQSGRMIAVEESGVLSSPRNMHG